MTFEDVVDQALAMLQRRGRMAYRTLKRQFNLDEEALGDLKAELIEAQRVAADEDGNVLVWTGRAASSLPPATTPERAPRTYTPPYLAEKILTSRAALEGERKQVTVLFADLKGSMELLADRDPEEARQLLDPVLERMMHAVHRYEGTVNQVMGDGIMALFGAPLAHEDHAVRACYAALAMQEAIRRYSEEVHRSHGVEVQIRVGLNSGAVVVRAIGNDLHMDYSAIGQTTHLAARMEQLALPGSIRLTAETLRLAEGIIQINALGPVPVKGLAVPVEVFELIGVTADRRRLQARSARGLTRFVGRQSEMTALGQALEQAAAGHGQVVAAVGEAGVGKSRLVYELVHSHYTRSWHVLESASVSYGKATPFFPVIELLKRYFGIEGHDEPQAVRAKVTGHVLTLDETLHEMIPAFLSLLEVLPEDSPFLTLDPLQRRQRILTALKRLLLRESHVQPLLLVFEDLHWIDAETQALLDSLVESVPTTCVLLLVNYRPEYRHAWGSKSYYTQLRLDPLRPESAEEFLYGLMGDGEDLEPLTRLLITRTEGNPFFLEESVRTLVETAVLVGDRGAYRLAKALPSIQVPATVMAVLAARIDRLPPEEKSLLQTAAVIGIEVPLPLLQAIAEAPEARLRLGLTHLQAAEKAMARSAHREAVTNFEQALSALPHLPERRETFEQAIDLRINLRHALFALGYHTQLLDHLRKAEALAEALHDQRRLGRVVAFMSEYFRTRGEAERALACGQRAFIIAEALGDFALQVETHHHLGRVYHTLGDYRQAIDCFRWNVESLGGALLRERFGMPAPPSVFSRMWLVRSLAEVGAFAEGSTYGDEAIQIAEAVAQPWSRIGAYYGVGLLSLRQGAFHKAITVLERGLTLCQATPIALMFPLVASQLGYAYALSGQVSQGLPLLEQAMEHTAAAIGSEAAVQAACLSHAYLLGGRLQDASTLAGQALEFSRVHKKRGHQAYALRLLGEIAAQREPPEFEPAKASYLQALTLAEELSMRPLQAHCHRGLGTFYAKIGRCEQACAELSTAIALYRMMAMTFWLPQAEAALAQLEER